MKEPKHILNILNQTKAAVKKEDTIKLKELSNQTMHSASIQQDTDSIMIAVILYSLSKMLERTGYHSNKEWKPFLKNLMRHIDNSIHALKHNKQKKLSSELGKITQEISSLSGDFKKSIRDVFKKAKINKASRIYEHGLSMEKTAKLLGVSIWDLAEYTGQTGVSDVNLNVTMPIKKRIKIAEEIFR